MKNRLIIKLTWFQVIGLAFGSGTAFSVELPRRISGQVLDLGKVHTIYMVPGMASMIEIPTAVTGIRLGNPDAVQYFRPDRPENEVTLILKDSNAKPTNLIIRSGNRKFVFDIVPSTQIHQDTIEVMGSYGGPEIQDSSAVLIASSEKNRLENKIDATHPTEAGK